MSGGPYKLVVPAGYQQITSLGSATALTLPTGAMGAVMCLVQAETQSIRWRDDGTNPTASTGMVLSAGADMLYCGKLDAIRFIQTAASAKLNITYYN